MADLSKTKVPGSVEQENLTGADFYTWEFSKEKTPSSHKIGKTAIIGDKDIITVFKSVGFDIFPAREPHKIKDIINSLANKDYSIILITEREAEQVKDFINTFRIQPYPIILAIPDGTERIYLGLEKVQKTLEKVSGATGGKK